MIKYIKIKNFLSIRDEIEVNFESTNRGNKKGNVFNINGNTISRSTLIYGANASGKTNILKVFMFLINFISFSYKEDFLSLFKPFLLDNESKNEPSCFELYLSNKYGDFKYILKTTSKEVILEELYEVNKNSEKLLFSRKNQDITAGETFKNELDKGKDKIKSNTSVISVLSQWNGKINNVPIEKIFSGLNIVLGNFPMGLNLNLLDLNNNPKKKEIVIEFLKSADINIDDIRLSDTSDLIQIKNSNGDFEQIINKRTLIEFGHKIKGGNIEFFSINNESEGTQRLFSLLGPIIDTVLNGGVLIIDEIERNLHNHILMNLFKFIHSQEISTNFQFIFTTHNIDLLDLNIFKKEQIGLVNKEKYNSTTYNTLYDYDIRGENDVKKMYDNGAFGAIPKLKDFTNLISSIEELGKREN